MARKCQECPKSPAGPVLSALLLHQERVSLSKSCPGDRVIGQLSVYKHFSPSNNAKCSKFTSYSLTKFVKKLQKVVQKKNSRKGVKRISTTLILAEVTLFKPQSGDLNKVPYH